MQIITIHSVASILMCVRAYIKLLIQQNSKPQMYTDGSVTKDQSGWGSTTTQSATTIKTVQLIRSQPSAGFPQEVSQTTHAITLKDSMSLLQEVKNRLGSPN